MDKGKDINPVNSLDTTKYYWNGEPCTAVFRNYRIIDKVKDTPAHWMNAHINELRQCVEISTPDSEPFYIDNHYGMGYAKITAGEGMWTHGSKHIEKAAVKLLSVVEPVTKFSTLAYKVEQKVEREYLRVHVPKEYKKIKALEEGMRSPQKRSHTEKEQREELARDVARLRIGLRLCHIYMDRLQGSLKQAAKRHSKLFDKSLSEFFERLDKSYLGADEKEQLEYVEALESTAEILAETIDEITRPIE